ncbi:hypothetical protein I4F81_003597 [Pyropia yezoensis]|uniref:Uncharacterized protein n=1 Tax=Pyropia yezoensis TaxID=2788 RepID=A0ACC3BTU2_PYRYE|nr:hypothetical protein I4F81_003597 [Neopyropia yezoensis]
MALRPTRTPHVQRQHHLLQVRLCPPPGVVAQPHGAALGHPHPEGRVPPADAADERRWRGPSAVPPPTHPYAPYGLVPLGTKKVKGRVCR